METSRMTYKYQATIPKKVREYLALGADDRVSFRIVRGRVILEKDKPHDPAYLRAMENTLGAEWNSKADEDAYRDL